MTLSDIIFIDDNDSFLSYCQTLQTKSVIALDTEFLRVNTFYPKPGLFQINDGQQMVLVDPCKITAWELFKAILSSSSIVKVLHACDEDIELFYHFLQVETQGVFDTQIAAAFCGYDFCMGYQRLLQSALNVDLEKGLSRSDWMRRPLSAEQVQYAADDVRYLLPLYEMLVQKINARDLMKVMEEEYQSVLQAISSSDFDNAYMRIKEAWKLNSRQFSVLKALAAWRERLMRERDLPRKRVATDDALLMMASRSHWSLAQLFEVEGLPSFVVRQYGQLLLELMESAQQTVSGEKCSKPVKADHLYNQMKKLLEKAAKAFGVEEKMLSKKQFNEQMYWQIQQGSFEVPSEISGWRRPLYQQVALLLEQDIESVK